MDPYHYPDDGPIAFRRERDLGDVIRVTIEWMREMAGLWIPAVASIAGPLYLISAVVSSVVPLDSPVVGLTGIVDGIAGLMMTSVIFGILRLYRVGQTDLTIGGVWAEAKDWIWPQVGFGFLSAFLAFLLLIPFGIIFAVAGAAAGSPVLLVGLGLAVLVLVCFALPYYVLGLASRIFDEDSAIDGYKRAAGLIGAHRLLATGTTLVIFGIVYFIAAVLGGGVQALLLAFGVSPVVMAIGTVGAVIVLVPASVFGSVASVFLFETLIEREEGTLLDDEIEAIREGAPEEPRQPVVPPPVEPKATLEAPDTRSFAERLRDDRRAQDGESTDPDASSTPSDERRGGGFRGGGFEDLE